MGNAYSNNRIKALNQPCDILKDDIGTKYGLRNDGIVGRLYSLVSRTKYKIEIKEDGTQITFSFIIPDQLNEILTFNKDCYKLLQYKL